MVNIALLRLLSATDFLSVKWCKVPKNFKPKNPNGEEISGVAMASNLSDPISHGHLFRPLIEELVMSVPEQLFNYNGQYAKSRMELPEEPLMVTTVVIEREDGQLVPVVS